MYGNRSFNYVGACGAPVTTDRQTNSLERWVKTPFLKVCYFDWSLAGQYCPRWLKQCKAVQHNDMAIFVWQQVGVYTYSLIIHIYLYMLWIYLYIMNNNILKHVTCNWTMLPSRGVKNYHMCQPVSLSVALTRGVHLYCSKDLQTYRQVSNIRRTKFQLLKYSRAVLRLSLPNLLKPRCQVENEDVVGAAPTGDAPTTSEWSTILLPA